MMMGFLAVVALASATANGGGQAAAAKHSSIVKITCPYADFEFERGASLADVTDRNYPSNPIETVGQISSTPKNYVISWDRSNHGLLRQIFRNRYLINRETGAAAILVIDEMEGTAPIERNDQKSCKFN